MILSFTVSPRLTEDADNSWLPSISFEESQNIRIDDTNKSANNSHASELSEIRFSIDCETRSLLDGEKSVPLQQSQKFLLNGYCLTIDLVDSQLTTSNLYQATNLNYIDENYFGIERSQGKDELSETNLALKPDDPLFFLYGGSTKEKEHQFSKPKNIKDGNLSTDPLLTYFVEQCDQISRISPNKNIEHKQTQGNILAELGFE